MNELGEVRGNSGNWTIYFLKQPVLDQFYCFLLDFKKTGLVNN